MNTVYNTALGNIQDIPLFLNKQGSDPSGSEKNFAMTARQSRLNLRYQGGQVAGATLSGQFEFDLLGGKAAFPNAMNMDLLRIRLAFGRLDWESFSLVAGQDWSIFAPLNPTTLAAFAIPGLSASGNPWIRQPQIRAEFRRPFGETAQFPMAIRGDRSQHGRLRYYAVRLRPDAGYRRTRPDARASRFNGWNSGIRPLRRIRRSRPVSHL